MPTSMVDGFGILLGVDVYNEREGVMLELGEEDVGKRFALTRGHFYGGKGWSWSAVDYAGSYGVEDYEWEITSVVKREGL